VTVRRLDVETGRDVVVVGEKYAARQHQTNEKALRCLGCVSVAQRARTARWRGLWAIMIAWLPYDSAFQRIAVGRTWCLEGER